MAKKVAQQMMMCNSCGRKTLHQKNTKEISWLMHLVLTIFTGGLWLIVWVLILMWHAIAKPASAAVNRWVCSQCGD
ncbi:hypothetical protein [Acinetobacter sp. CFCC 10889]|uniref:hypothetical protein n=1 Tax=Acinetobacter sp. CFCC 10889 TaxID=1775557 RepID=UPI000DCFC9F2|nr:hypothetical protein [Acinetobacter sp. CFCC 10889]